MEPVELSTEGLLLRGWVAADAEAVYRACQDPLIQRWTTVPVPYLRQHAAGFVGEYAANRWRDATAAPLGIFDAATGELLGSHGLVELDLAQGIGETGAWVAPWARGRRVAEHATRAVARWALDVLGLRLLVWRVEVGNHASRLVAARVGFTFDGPARALLATPGGGLVDGWRGTMRPGEIRDEPPIWYARGAPGARRAAVFGRAQPVLSAGEVTLRPLRDSDIDPVTEASRDPESTRWLNLPDPYTRPDAVAFVCDHAPVQWLLGTTTIFCIAGPDDRYAGSIDLRIDPVDPTVAEIGYLVARYARGKGYATAATRAICAWGFETLGLARIMWRAHVGNVASRRVAEKAGFVAEGVQRGGCAHRGERRDAWVAGLLAP